MVVIGCMINEVIKDANGHEHKLLDKHGYFCTLWFVISVGCIVLIFDSNVS